MHQQQKYNQLYQLNLDKSYHNQFDHLPGNKRTSSDKKITLGKKLNVAQVNRHFQNHLRLIGMSQINLIAEWKNIVTNIYANYSIPVAIKNISGVKILICKVLYTRIIEFQHEKENFIQKINLFSGITLINDIRFIRATKIPSLYSTNKKETSQFKNIPNEVHPFCSEHNNDTKNIILQKNLNQLAHLLFPVQSQDSNLAVMQQKPVSPIIDNWRKRAKILLNNQNK